MSTQAAALPVTAPVDAVVAELRNRLSGARFRDAERLVAVFFRRVPAEELGARPPASWAALLCGMMDLLSVRVGDSANVRVFNPTLEEHGWDSHHTVIQIVTNDGQKPFRQE